jgi:hypothetical protein
LLFETEDEEQANSVAFVAAIKRLFAVLKEWEKEDAIHAGGIALAIEAGSEVIPVEARGMIGYGY